MGWNIADGLQFIQRLLGIILGCSIYFNCRLLGERFKQEHASPKSLHILSRSPQTNDLSLSVLSYMYTCITVCWKGLGSTKKPRFHKEIVCWPRLISRLRGNLKGIQDSMEMQAGKDGRCFSCFAPNPVVNKNDIKIDYHFYLGATWYPGIT